MTGPNITVHVTTGMSAVLPPLSVMASWPPPNHIDPPSRAALMVATEIPLAAITTLIVALRLFSRAYLTGSTRSVALDDWLMLGAVVAANVLTGLHMWAIKYGWALHIWDVRMEWLIPAQKLVMASEILFCAVVSLTKLSILTFYLRVFSSYRTFKKLCYFGIFFCVSWMVAVLFLGIFQCIPVNAFWDLSIPATCIDMYAGVMSTSTLNSVSDFFLFILPIRWVWMLQLPKKQRIGLVLAFSLGGVACIAGVVRLHFLHMAFRGNWDVTWHGAASYITTSLEADVGIICASIPALKPLFVRIVNTTTHAASGLSRSNPNTSGRSRGGTMTVGGGTFDHRRGPNSAKRISEYRGQSINLGSLETVADSINEDHGRDVQRTVRDEEDGRGGVKSGAQVGVFALGDDRSNRSATTVGENGDEEKLWKNRQNSDGTASLGHAKK